MSATDAIREANEQLDAGDASEAYDTITAALEYPAVIDGVDLPGALDALARSAAEIFGEEWGEAIAPAAAAADDADALGAAGTFLVEQGFAAMAVTVLSHATRLAPTDPALLAELVTGHEQLGDHAGAVRVIDAADPAARDGFLPQYLLAFNAMMSFDADRASATLPALRDAAATDADRFMVGRIEGMLARLDALVEARVATPREDLQVWHLVRTGGLLLDAERKNRVDDTLERCRSSIERVRSLLAALGIVPSAVLTLPNGSSQVLGEATAQALDVPTASWPDHAEDPGLVVAYDIERLADHVGGALAIHETDQILWSHADRWTIDHGVTPDIATFLHQHVTQPWAAELDGEGLAADAVAAWSARVAAASPAPVPASDDRLVELAEATRGCGEHAAGVFRNDGRREKQFAVPLVDDPF